MKTLIMLIVLCVASTSFAETWKDREIREEREQKIQLLRLQQQNNPQQTPAQRNDVGQCMGDCGSEQGICISYCNGNGNCVARCSDTHGRCVSRCN